MPRFATVVGDRVNLRRAINGKIIDIPRRVSGKAESTLLKGDRLEVLEVFPPITGVRNRAWLRVEFLCGVVTLYGYVATGRGHSEDWVRMDSEPSIAPSRPVPPAVDAPKRRPVEEEHEDDILHTPDRTDSGWGFFVLIALGLAALVGILFMI